MTSAPSEKMLIYRLDLPAAQVLPASPESAPLFIVDAAGVTGAFGTWFKTFGFQNAVKTALKVWSRKRIFFGMEINGRIVQYGWANLGFCRHYPIERDAVVLGDLYTVPDHRGQGLGSTAMRQVIAWLSQRNVRRFYVDTTVANTASQRMIQKAGFSKIS